MGSLKWIPGRSRSDDVVVDFHKDFMMEAANIIQKIGAKKLESIDGALKLRKKGHPVYHEQSHQVPGVYDNTLYSNSVQSLLPYNQAYFQTLSDNVQSHLNYLKKNEAPKKMRQKTEEVRDAIDQARTWALDHEQDPNALNSVVLMKQGGLPLQLGDPKKLKKQAKSVRSVMAKAGDW